MTDKTDTEAEAKVDYELAPVTSLYTAYAVDRNLSEEGKWFDNVGVPGVRMKLRRYTSHAAQHARREVLQEYSDKYGQNTQITAELEDRMQCEQAARGVIVDWENVVGPNGQTIEHSREAAFELLWACPDVKIYIDALVQPTDAFRVESVKAVEGNS